MSPGDDHGAERERLRAMLSTDRERAVVGLRAAEERWAREAIGIPVGADLVAGVRARVEAGLSSDVAAAAVAHLVAAEDRQWEIGTWASGPGEGLASMTEVRALQVARAWLLSCGDSEARSQALELLAQVAADPNRAGEFHAAHVDALRVRLGEPRPEP